MWSRGRFSRAFGTASVIFCWWCTSSEALCTTVYGSSAGTDDPFDAVKLTSNDMFTCAEGTFLRSVVFAGLPIRVVGIQYECSDGELSELFGEESLNHWVMSCPDPEGFGIGSISMAFDDNIHKAEVRCAGEQACSGWVCDEEEDGEPGTACYDGGKADYCGPIGWDPATTYNTSTTSECLDEEYIVGFRTLSQYIDDSTDGVNYITAACASRAGCPLDRPPTFWEDGINIARAIFGGIAAIFFILASVWVLYQRRSATRKKQTTPETYTASLAGAFTALGGTLAEALAGSNAAAVGFAVTCAFALLCAYHCHPTAGHPTAGNENLTAGTTPSDAPSSFFGKEPEIALQHAIRV